MTSYCSTDTERPHRCCHLLNKVENIDHTPDSPCTLQWAGRCSLKLPTPLQGRFWAKIFGGRAPRLPFLSLEVVPLKYSYWSHPQATGSGGAISTPSRVWTDPQRKSNFVHFSLKM